MDKLQAYHSFWSGFGLKAYDETSVPDDAVMPYITYEVAQDSFNYSLALTASIWYRSSSWIESVDKLEQITDSISRGGKLISYDGGAFWVKRANPWAQRLADESDDSVRRTILNVEIEFID